MLLIENLTPTPNKKKTDSRLILKPLPSLVFVGA
jgi:hypothetical protein